MSLERKLDQAKKKGDKNKLNLVFEEIFNEYQKLVIFVLQKYIDIKEDIEEEALDVFLKFYDSCLKVDIRNIKNYLVKIAKNESINYLKKKKNVVINCDIDEFFKTETYDTTEYYELIKELETVLAPDETKILILHVIYSYSFVEISKQFKAPVTTISSKYHRAIKKLKRRGY